MSDTNKLTDREKRELKGLQARFAAIQQAVQPVEADVRRRYGHVHV